MIQASRWLGCTGGRLASHHASQLLSRDLSRKNVVCVPHIFQGEAGGAFQHAVLDVAVAENENEKSLLWPESTDDCVSDGDV